MSAPTPNGPTLNDLAYNAYNPGGSLNTTAFVPPLNIAVNDTTRTSENMIPNFVAYTATVDVSDVINNVSDGSEVKVAVGPTGPTLITLSAIVSDTVVTSENTVLA